MLLMVQMLNMTYFQNRKWNNQNRKWNYFSPLPAKKLLLQHCLHINQGIQNWSFKQEMELLKQDMKLFLPPTGLWAKNFLYNIFSIFTKEFKIDFQNRKWNYSKRKWDYFCHFQSSDRKTSLTKIFLFPPRSSKLIFKTGIGII